jgi:hypothetical protein
MWVVHNSLLYKTHSWPASQVPLALASV